MHCQSPDDDDHHDHHLFGSKELCRAINDSWLYSMSLSVAVADAEERASMQDMALLMYLE